MTGAAGQKSSPIGRAGVALSAILEGAAGKALVTILDQGIVSATNFFASIVIVRSCTKDEFGLYMLGLSIALLAMNTQNSLITSAYIVFSPRLEGDERCRYAGSTLIHEVLLAVAFTLALPVAGLLYVLGGGSEGLERVLFALTLAISGIMFKEYARQLCFAGLQAFTVFMLDSAVFVLQLGGLIVLALAGGVAADRALWVTGGATLLATLGWLSMRRGAFAPDWRWAGSDFGRNWTYCRWIFAMNLAYIGSNQVYPWLLYTFHGPEANGVFGACFNVVFFANPFILGLGNFLGPKAVHAYTSGGVHHMQSVVYKATLFFTVTMTLFCAGMLLFGNWILVLLCGEQYDGNGGTVFILALSQLVWSLTIPVNYALNAVERPDVAFKSLVLALIFTFTAGIWMVAAFGPAGIAGGLLAGNIIACVYNRIVYVRQVRVLFQRERAMPATEKNWGEQP